MRHLLLILALAVCLGTPASAAVPSLIVILLPGTSLQDWQQATAPNLHRLMQTGALGVMNTRSAHHAGQQGRETPESILLTLGAGSRASGSSDAVQFSSVSAPVPGLKLSSGELYERRIGLLAPHDRLVCTGWPTVADANRSLGYDLLLGNLADTLAEHGITVEAGGGPDADWIAASADGTAAHSATLSVEPGHCLIWDAGSNIANADALVAAAAAKCPHLIVLSPYPNEADYGRENRLTPVLVWGDGIPQGLLTSDSTRRLGLVTDTDFAPSVAAYFGVTRSQFLSRPFGFAWSVVPSPDSTAKITKICRQSVQQAGGMRLLPYLAAVTGFWVLAVTFLPVTRRHAGFLTLVPLTALMAALFSTSALSFGLTFLGLLALMLAGDHTIGAEWTLIILTSVAVAAISADTLTGSLLMHHGLLGYSAIEGARYYGIGNEAMGLLLGASVAAASYLWTRGRAWPFFLSTIFAAISLLLGSAGAKAGGVIVSLAVFGTFIYTAYGRQWTGRVAAGLLSIITAGLAAAALGDAFFLPHEHSHIGEAVQRMTAGGSGEGMDIIRRKLMVEGHLAYHSAWAILLWASIACTLVSWKRAAARNALEAATRSAGLVGVAACLLFNDAGVVAAAIFAACLWSVTAMQKQSLPAPE